MGGIIAGFLGGAGKGLADSGRMQLASILQKEQREADALRSSELQDKQNAFTAGQNEKYKVKAEDQVKISNDKNAADKKGKQTTQWQNVQNIVATTNQSVEEAIETIFPGATLKYTDKETGDTVVVVKRDGKRQEVGRYTKNDSDEVVWQNQGEDIPRTPGKFTRKEIKAEQDSLIKSTGTGDDYIPFNEQTKEDAKKSLTDKQSMGGIINNAAGGAKPQAGQAPQSALDFLEKNKNDPAMVAAFKQKYGTLPAGY